MRRAIRWAARLVPLAALATLLPGCFPRPPGDAPLRYRDALPGVTVSVTRDITYSTAQDGVANDLKLDVYRPTPDAVTRRPAIVFVHGGGFRSGTKDRDKAVELAKIFARRGYVTASIDYRLLKAGTPPSPGDGEGCVGELCVEAALAAQHDSQAAIRFLRKSAATYGIDTDRIAISGTSAGAGAALLVAVNEEDPGQSGHPLYPSGVRAAIPISGAVPPEQRPAFLDLLDRDDAPTLFFYGTGDDLVLPESVKSNVADMNEIGGGAFLQALDGGHVPFTPAAQEAYKTQGAYFLYRYLDLEHAAR